MGATSNVYRCTLLPIIYVRVVLLCLLYHVKYILTFTTLTDVKFYNERGNRIRQAIRDIEKGLELLDDLSNNEREYLKADETNIGGKKKHNDNEVDIAPDGEYEDLLANDFGRNDAPRRYRCPCIG